MCMPEAAVDEDHSPVLRENDVGRAWEVAIILTVAEAPVPEGEAQLDLRLGGVGVNGSHVTMALGWCKNVGHSLFMGYTYKNT